MIHISWYQRKGHLQRSRSNIRVMFLKRWVFTGISVSQTHLVSISKTNKHKYSSIWVSLKNDFKDVENIVLKREGSGYHHFLLFLTIFSNALFHRVFYTRDFWVNG